MHSFHIVKSLVETARIEVEVETVASLILCLQSINKISHLFFLTGLHINMPYSI